MAFKLPENIANRPIAILGAGTLGRRIALMLATRGAEVRLFSRGAATRDAGVARRGAAGIQAHFGAARSQHQRDTTTQRARTQDGDGAGGDILGESERHGVLAFWARGPPAG